MPKGAAHPPRVKVLVADSRLLFGEALGLALARMPGLEVVREYPTHGRQLIAAASSHRPDVAVVDYWMTEMDGTAAARMLAGTAPDCRVILLTWFHVPEDETRAISAGAFGLFSKSLEVHELAEIVRRAHRGDSASANGRRSRRSIRLNPDAVEGDPGEWRRLMTLTQREFDILGLLALRPMKKPVSGIAESLSLAEKTVRNHIQRILAKTEAGSINEAVAMARRHRLI